MKKRKIRMLNTDLVRQNDVERIIKKSTGMPHQLVDLLNRDISINRKIMAPAIPDVM
jgi:hypothetical protein